MVASEESSWCCHGNLWLLKALAPDGEGSALGGDLTWGVLEKPSSTVSMVLPGISSTLCG